MEEMKPIDFRRFIRFEQIAALNISNNVEIWGMIYDNTKKKKYILKINIFMHIFNSTSKTRCSLLEYHSTTYGKNCQFIGFLGSQAKNDDIEHFSGSDRSRGIRIPYILDLINIYLDEIQPGIDNKAILRKRESFANISIIGNETDYHLYYSKDVDFFIAKLEYAASRNLVIDVDSRGEHSGQTYIEVEQDYVTDEFIVIANKNIPVFTVEIFEFDSYPEKKPINVLDLYDIIKRLFMSDDYIDDIFVKDIYIENKSNLDLREIYMILNFTNYYHDNYKERFMRNLSIITLIRNIQYLYYTNLHIYQKKYLKYKQKYNELKKNINK